MKRYIVTGGAGFIGAHLTNRLIREGYAVTIIDNLSTGSIENLNTESEFIKGDISEPKDIEKLPFDGVEGVFHLAAQSSGEVSFEDPYADLKVNVGGTVLLLDWCRKHDIRRFIFISSMGVYSQGSEIPLPENAPSNPKSFYGIGKLAAEHYVRAYGVLGLNTTIIRPFNVYGPMQNLNNMKQGMASIYMSFLLKDEPILVKGSIDRFRDQTYVVDVVEAIMRCMRNPASVNQTYNIATGRKTTVRELINTMLNISGKSIDDYPVQVTNGTPGDIFGIYADVSKAERELGWSSCYGLEQGLKEMFKYYTEKNE